MGITDVIFVDEDMFPNQPREMIRVFNAVYYSEELKVEWVNGYRSAEIL